MVAPAREAPSGPEFNLVRGDKIRGWATWNVPRNYENPGSADSAGQLTRRGVFLIGRIKSLRLLETIPGGCSDPWTGVANYVGARVRKSLEPIREWGKGQPAAILASLIIGDYSGLDNTTRETFQNSGTFHVLVVSGLHVAWIAGVLLKICELISVPERIRYFAAFLVILLYTCVVGFQASITRCLWMFLLYLIGRMIFRRADTVNILLGSALVLLLAQPYWLLEAGFQLSFLSVLAIAITAAPAINNYLKPLWEPLLHSGKSDDLFLQPGRWHRWGRRIRVSCELFIEEITDPLPPSASRISLMVFRGIAADCIAANKYGPDISCRTDLAGPSSRLPFQPDQLDLPGCQHGDRPSFFSCDQRRNYCGHCCKHSLIRTGADPACRVACIPSFVLCGPHNRD